MIKLENLLKILLLVIISTQSTKSQDTEQYIFDSELDSICKSFLVESGVAGFSIAIAKDNELLFAKGYGNADREKGRVATPATIYPIASVSKFVTAIAIMKLVDQKKLKLDDDVLDILPGFPQQSSMNRITIDHLLRHTSGLVDYMKWVDSLTLSGTTVSDTEFINFINRPLLFKPGTEFSYSNSGFKALTMIIEKISGLQFHDFIVKEIAEPMGLPSLGVWPYNSTHPDATVNYEIHNDSIQIGTIEDLPYFSGDGALSASVIDIVKLPGLLQEEKIFPEHLLNKMLSQTILGSFKIDYGTGTRLGNVSGHPVWGHSGGASGSTLTKLDYFPEEKLCISITINTLFGPKNALDLEEAILPLLLGLEKPKAKTNLINPQQYEGSFSMRDRWGGDNGSVRVISERGGKLFRDNPITDTPGQELFYLGEDMFRNDFYPLDRFKFHFVKGKVVACSEYVNGMFIQVRLAE